MNLTSTGPQPPHKPTMVDVAERAGVSRALVSIVFRNKPGASPQTRERVRKAAAELGYRPDVAAQRLARTHSSSLGVMFTLRNPFHTAIVERLYTEAGEHDLDLVLSTVGPHRSESVALDFLSGQRCAGYLLLGALTPPALIGELAGRLPTVVVGQSLPAGVADTVRYDDGAGVVAGLEHLVQLGHQRIAYIAGARGRSLQTRRRAFEKWTATHADQVAVKVVDGADTEAAGRAAVAQLLTGPMPSAIMAVNDRCALGVLDGLFAAGIGVPDRVSVVGFDDIDLSELGGIGLTTVHQDTTVLAASAIEAMTRRIANPDAPVQDTVFTPLLRPRRTTAAPTDQVSRPGPRSAGAR